MGLSQRQINASRFRGIFRGSRRKKFTTLSEGRAIWKRTGTTRRNGTLHDGTRRRDGRRKGSSREQRMEQRSGENTSGRNVRVHVSSIWRMKRNPFPQFRPVPSKNPNLPARRADVTDVAFPARQSLSRTHMRASASERFAPFVSPFSG